MSVEGMTGLLGLSNLQIGKNLDILYGASAT